MGAPPGQQDEVVADIVKAYVTGLLWVMNYYYEGCVSWTW
jgi:5'-3' exonuclease